MLNGEGESANNNNSNGEDGESGEIEEKKYSPKEFLFYVCLVISISKNLIIILNKS